MNEDEIIRYITETFDDVHVFTADDGTSYFFYDPERKFPFTTLVTSDAHDNASDLNRPSVYRLNIGVNKQTFQSRFGSQPSEADDGGDSGYDFTALNQLMPHPVYARQHWVSILNPSAETFETVVRPLLAEAYEIHFNRYAKRVKQHQASTSDEG